jgi:hypothetical protein
MNDSLAVGSFERLRNLDAEIEEQFQIHGTSRDAMLQSGPIEKFHRKVSLPILFTNFVNRADVRMVEGRGGSRLPPESLESLQVFGQVIRKKLQRNVAAKIRVLSLVNNAHPAATELFDDAVMRDGTADGRLGFRHERCSY